MGQEERHGKFGRFFWAMMDRGIYLPCSQFEAVSDERYTEEHVRQTIAAAKERWR